MCSRPISGILEPHDRSNTRNVPIPSVRMLNFKEWYMIDLDLNLAAEICLESSYFPCFFFSGNNLLGE